MCASGLFVDFAAFALLPVVVVVAVTKGPSVSSIVFVTAGRALQLVELSAFASTNFIGAVTRDSSVANSTFYIVRAIALRNSAFRCRSVVFLSVHSVTSGAFVPVLGCALLESSLWIEVVSLFLRVFALVGCSLTVAILAYDCAVASVNVVDTVLANRRSKLVRFLRACVMSAADAFQPVDILVTANDVVNVRHQRQSGTILAVAVVLVFGAVEDERALQSLVFPAASTFTGVRAVRLFTVASVNQMLFEATPNVCDRIGCCSVAVRAKLPVSFCAVSPRTGGIVSLSFANEAAGVALEGVLLAVCRSSCLFGPLVRFLSSLFVEVTADGAFVPVVGVVVVALGVVVTFSLFPLADLALQGVFRVGLAVFNVFEYAVNGVSTGGVSAFGASCGVSTVLVARYAGPLVVNVFAFSAANVAVLIVIQCFLIVETVLVVVSFVRCVVTASRAVTIVAGLALLIFAVGVGCGRACFPVTRGASSLVACALTRNVLRVVAGGSALAAATGTNLIVLSVVVVAVRLVKYV